MSPWLEIYLIIGVYVLGVCDGIGWAGMNPLRREIRRVTALLAWPAVVMIAVLSRKATP